MKVYISGKIGGEVISEATRRKFARAEAMLKAKGYSVFNPTDGEIQQRWKAAWDRKLAENWDYPVDFYPFALLLDLHSLARCDAVYFLGDWSRSNGANVEHSFAMATGKKMLWELLEDAQVFHNDNETAEEVWLPTEEEEDTV